jgi:hypothetical protein
MDLAVVHAWTSHELHAWTFYRCPFMDQKKLKPLFEKKPVALEGFELQSTAWKSTA